ncbi:AimR family lysis-lysogeny pheromone receptor [Shouchella lonarensis]|uniref:Regulatory protein, luxR family n=1 Tax=Shouchella lonarensis TaxID=1464122 RepID=A0A1G6GI66_9BACI|nr:AimR family lysis-lysogeny pheromone receptor [Shouchella lonarensis]SDB81599.1 regulatory protein, luxR family [Shouchella lonarensis]
MQKYRERWRENFLLYRKGFVPQHIKEHTKNQLQRMDLWENERAWTHKAMHNLALERHEHGHPLLPFEQVLYSVRTFASDRFVQLMNEYVLALQTPSHIRDAFEYAVQYRQTDLLELLIHQSKDRESLKEWALVYELLLDVDVMRGRFSHEETISQARDLLGHVKAPFLKARLELLEVATYLKLEYHARAAYASEKIFRLLENVDDSYAKRIVESHTEFQIAYDLLYNQGKLSEAEKRLGQSIVNGATPETMLAYHCHLLAYATFLMPISHETNLVEPSIEYIQQALFYAEQTGSRAYSQRLRAQDLPFIWNSAGKIFELEDVNQIDPSEKVHQYIVRGEREKALLLADELERSGQNSVFLTLYKAKAERNIIRLYDILLETPQDHVYLLPLVKQEILRVHRIKDDELKRTQMQFRTFKWQVTLSPRELEVLALIYHGYTQLEIAKKLYLSTSTVKKHVNHILKKTGLHSSKEAASVAKQLLLF